MSLRDVERATISLFLTKHQERFTGRVLDYGCGQQPYRQIVEAVGGEYLPYDRARFGGSVVSEDIGDDPMGPFDAVIMTQVWQYMAPKALDVALEAMVWHGNLNNGGWLVATGPTNWPVVELDDLWRTTPAGARQILHDAGFVDVMVEPRHGINHEGEEWLCGWGAVAQCRW